MLTAEFLKKIENGEYDVNRSQIVTLHKVSKGHIFDEDLSVKRNKELVEENNEAYINQCKEYNTKRHELNSQLYVDAVSVLVHEYGVSTEKASVIYDYAYRESHSAGMQEVFQTADELFDLVANFNDAK